MNKGVVPPKKSDSPFFSTIGLSKKQLFSLGFRRFSGKKHPWKEWGRHPYSQVVLHVFRAENRAGSPCPKYVECGKMAFAVINLGGLGPYRLTPITACKAVHALNIISIAAKELPLEMPLIVPTEFRKGVHIHRLGPR